MKRYIVQITDKALADMEEIYDYIAMRLQAPENALGQYIGLLTPLKNWTYFQSVSGLWNPNQSIQWV